MCDYRGTTILVLVWLLRSLFLCDYTGNTILLPVWLQRNHDLGACVIIHRNDDLYVPVWLHRNHDLGSCVITHAGTTILVPVWLQRNHDHGSCVITQEPRSCSCVITEPRSCFLCDYKGTTILAPMGDYSGTTILVLVWLHRNHDLCSCVRLHRNHDLGSCLITEEPRSWFLCDYTGTTIFVEAKNRLYGYPRGKIWRGCIRVIRGRPIIEVHRAFRTLWLVLIRPKSI